MGRGVRRGVGGAVDVAFGMSCGRSSAINLRGIDNSVRKSALARHLSTRGPEAFEKNKMKTLQKLFLKLRLNSFVNCVKDLVTAFLTIGQRWGPPGPGAELSLNQLWKTKLTPEQTG